MNQLTKTCCEFCGKPESHNVSHECGNTMEKAIKKAIEGGWKPSHVGGWAKCKNAKEVLESFNYFYPDEESIKQHRHFFEYFLDPTFWQALGKSCGWDKQMDLSVVSISTRRKVYMPIWKIKALCFHEINLTEGWAKAIEFLQEITKEK